MTSQPQEITLTEHPVRLEYINRITPDIAKQINHAWMTAASNELYGQGMELLAPHAHGHDLPENVMEFERQRRTLPEPQLSLVRPSMSMWAHLVHQHGHLLTQDQRATLTAPWDKLVELVSA